MRIHLVATIGLSLLMTTSPAHADGWADLGQNEPSETDPARLCSEVDRDRSPIVSNAPLECERAVERYANRPPTQRAAAEPALARCRAAIGENPRLFFDFSVNRTCSFILTLNTEASRALQFDNRMRSKGSRPATKLMAEVDRTHAAHGECLQIAKAFVATGVAARERGAGSAPLADLLAVPATMRTPAEANRVGAERALCRAEAARRRQTRLASMSVDSVSAIADRYRLPEERAFLAEHEADALAIYEESRLDPTRMGPVFSALICLEQDARSEAMREIAAQRRYSKVGGVRNLSVLYELQSDVRAADESIATLRTKARRLRARVTSCKDRRVNELVECIAQGQTAAANSSCRAGDMPMNVRLARGASE